MAPGFADTDELNDVLDRLDEPPLSHLHRAAVMVAVDAIAIAGMEPAQGAAETRRARLEALLRCASDGLMFS